MGRVDSPTTVDDRLLLIKVGNYGYKVGEREGLEMIGWGTRNGMKEGGDFRCSSGNRSYPPPPGSA
eukprot:749283-Hanusia_phi.AAC.5